MLPSTPRILAAHFAADRARSTLNELLAHGWRVNGGAAAQHVAQAVQEAAAGRVLRLGSRRCATCTGTRSGRGGLAFSISSGRRTVLCAAFECFERRFAVHRLFIHAGHDGFNDQRLALLGVIGPIWLAGE